VEACSVSIDFFIVEAGPDVNFVGNERDEMPDHLFGKLYRCPIVFLAKGKV
jgi:hypothetical protein